MPDGTTCASGTAIILSAEDSVKDTIKPRLMAMGADSLKVFTLDAVHSRGPSDEIISRTLNLKHDIHLLEEEIARRGDVSLLVIDPLSAYLKGVNSHNNAAVRFLLSTLEDMAFRHSIAVVAVMHLNKRTGKVIDRVSGLGAFSVSPRTFFLICKDRINRNRRLFLTVKNNLGDDTFGMAFCIEPVRLTENIETSKIVWEPERVNMSVDEAMSADINPSNLKAIDEAKNFLNELLQDGPQTTKTIRTEAYGMGLSWATVRRAQQQLGIKPIKDGFQGEWM